MRGSLGSWGGETSPHHQQTSRGVMVWLAAGKQRKTGCQTRSLDAFLPSCCCGCAHLHGAVDPGQNAAHSGVDARLLLLSAASPPAGDAHQEPAAVLLADQRSTTVPLGNKTTHISLKVSCSRMLEWRFHPFFTHANIEATASSEKPQMLFCTL